MMIMPSRTPEARPAQATREQHTAPAQRSSSAPLPPTSCGRLSANLKNLFIHANIVFNKRIQDKVYCKVPTSVYNRE